MALSTRYRFADAPTSAIVGDSSLGWTTTAGTLAAAGTSLSVASSSPFPADGEFDVIIGARNTTTGVWTNAEVRHVTAVSGATWTVSTGALSHVSGESISHVLTAEGIQHNPGALTDSGDVPYLNASGRMDRLAAPANGAYSVTWTSGVPSWTAAGSGGISFPDLASPPPGTALGSDALPFDYVAANGALNFNNYFGVAPTANVQVSIVRTIDPAADFATNLYVYSEFYPAADVAHLYGSWFEADVATAHNVGEFSIWRIQGDNDSGATVDVCNLVHIKPNITTGVTTLRGIFVEDMASSGATTIRPFNYKDTFFVDESGNVTAPNFIVSGSRFKSDTVDTHTGGLAVYDVNGAAYRDFLVWTNANEPAVVMSIPTTGTLSIDASTLTLNSVAVATASSATAFTNKTGAISQWTNDANYTTLAAVAGVGYLTSVTAHNILSTTHGDTLADAVVRGDLMYGNSTPKWARLPKPSVLSGLSHDGTDVSWVTATGTGAPVRAAGATLTTPTLGVAVATSLNGNTFTAGTYTLTGASGKTLTFNHSLTFAGTDSTTMTFPSTSATVARTDAGNAFTGAQSIAPSSTTLTSLTTSIGSSTTPAIVIGTTTNNGIYGSSSALFVSSFGTATAAFDYNNSGNFRVSSGTSIGFSSNSSAASAVADAFFMRGGAAATIQMGTNVNGAPVPQTFKAHNGITGTDIAGAPLLLQGGIGTGAGTVSYVAVGTPTALASSTTPQTITERVRIDANGIKATGYLSSDGSAGVTAGPFTTITSITVKNGLVTALTGA